MRLVLSREQTRYLRLKAQRLLAAERVEQKNPTQLLDHIVGVQAQDLNAARLSLRARGDGLTLEQVEKAQNDERSIAWTWCLRGTLHLVTPEDAAWLVPFLGPRFIAGDQGRMRSLGWDERSTQAGLRLLGEALGTQAELSRAEIVSLLRQNSLPHAGQAPAHLIFRAALDGRLCCKPGASGKTAYASSAGWIASWKALPIEEALAQLARRYLQAHAPAGAQDLAAWSGLSLGEARQALGLIEAQVIAVEAAGEPAWMLREQLAWLEEAYPAAPEVHLLPRFDTLWMGYTRRELWVETAFIRRILPGGGMIHPALMLDGRALGTWSMRRRKEKLEIAVEGFEKLPAEVLLLLEAEAADLGRFLGEETQLVTGK